MSADPLHGFTVPCCEYARVVPVTLADESYLGGNLPPEFGAFYWSPYGEAYQVTTGATQLVRGSHLTHGRSRVD